MAMLFPSNSSDAPKGSESTLSRSDSSGLGRALKGFGKLAAAAGLAFTMDSAQADVGAWGSPEAVDSRLGTSYNTQGTVVAFAGAPGGHGYLSVYESGSYKVKETMDGVSFTDVTANIAALDSGVGSRIYVTGYAPSRDEAFLDTSGSSYKIANFSAGPSGWVLTETANYSTGYGSVDDTTGDVVLTSQGSGDNDRILNETTNTILVDDAGDQTDGIIDSPNDRVAYTSDAWYATVKDYVSGDVVTLGDLYSYPTGYLPPDYSLSGNPEFLIASGTGTLDVVAQTDYVPPVEDTGVQDTGTDDTGAPEEDSEPVPGDSGADSTPVSESTPADDTGDSAEEPLPTDTDGDGVADTEDCDPENPAVGGQTIYYRDADGDGQGDPNVTEASCSQPEGYTTDATDCDDANDAFPDATGNCSTSGTVEIAPGVYANMEAGEITSEDVTEGPDGITVALDPEDAGRISVDALATQGINLDSALTGNAIALDSGDVVDYATGWFPWNNVNLQGGTPPPSDETLEPQCSTECDAELGCQPAEVTCDYQAPGEGAPENPYEGLFVLSVDQGNVEASGSNDWDGTSLDRSDGTTFLSDVTMCTPPEVNGDSGEAGQDSGALDSAPVGGDSESVQRQTPIPSEEGCNGCDTGGPLGTASTGVALALGALTRRRRRQ